MSLIPMKVLLTNSPLTEDRQKPWMMINSTGYLYLGSMLQEQEVFGMDKVADVRIDDVNVLGKDGFRRAVEAYDPAVMGTSVYEFNIDEVRSLIEDVKKTNPDITFAVGGPAATQIPKSVLRITGADIAFRGEADFTFREAVERLGRGSSVEDLSDIEGVVVRKNGKIYYGSESAKTPVIDQKTLRAIDIDFALVGDM